MAKYQICLRDIGSILCIHPNVGISGDQFPRVVIGRGPSASHLTYTTALAVMWGGPRHIQALLSL